MSNPIADLESFSDGKRVQENERAWCRRARLQRRPAAPAARRSHDDRVNGSRTARRRLLKAGPPIQVGRFPAYISCMSRTSPRQSGIQRTALVARPRHARKAAGLPTNRAPPGHCVYLSTRTHRQASRGPLICPILPFDRIDRFPGARETTPSERDSHRFGEVPMGSATTIHTVKKPDRVSASARTIGSEARSKGRARRPVSASGPRGPRSPGAEARLRAGVRANQVLALPTTSVPACGRRFP
jgi:hypothetical protein